MLVVLVRDCLGVSDHQFEDQLRMLIVYHTLVVKCACHKLVTCYTGSFTLRNVISIVFIVSLPNSQHTIIGSRDYTQA